MKRTLIVGGGLTTLMAAYIGSQLWAQSTPLAAPVAPTQTRMAFVNIDTIFQKYQKAKVYDEEIKKTLEPFRVEAEKLKAEIIKWTEDMKKPGFDPAQSERYQQGILTNKRKIEDLDRDAKKVIGKKAEEQVIQLYKEINEAVTAHARANGFHVVMAYGENTQMESMSYPNIMRKIQGAQMSGCAMPMYFDPGLDISLAVSDALNRRYPAAAGVTAPGGIVPTGGKTN